MGVYALFRVKKQASRWTKARFGVGKRLMFREGLDPAVCASAKYVNIKMA
jgi:hypothetical protein